MKHCYSWGCTPDEVVKELSPSDGFDMVIKSQDEWGAIAAAVNMGIDSHLEAFTKSEFDASTGKVWIHPEELRILVRRLKAVGESPLYEDWDYEHENNPAETLRADILTVIGVEEV